MENHFKNTNVLIVGLGLMGCAFADAMQSINPKGTYGIDIDKNIVKEAEKNGLINKGYTKAQEIVGKCDLIVICLYLEDAIDFVRENMAYFKKNCIITDIVGVKRNIIYAIQDNLRKDIDYIPGHPMAGKEKQKVDLPDKSIFKGRNYIITPTAINKTENIKFLKQWIYALGFSHIVMTDPLDHDKKIAFTSQLCHIIAASMVDMNNESDIVHYEGGSYKDMTRIAMINSKMWAELFIANKDMLINEIEKFQESMEQFKNLISSEDKQMINKLDEIKNKRENLNEID